jgi:hypothetical protein
MILSIENMVYCKQTFFYRMDGVIILVSIAIIGYFILRYIQRNKKVFSKKSREKIEAHLEKTETLPITQKIVELDKVLDECLKERGYAIGTLGERMKIYKGFTNDDAIWNAHKLRNALVHEMGFTPTNQQANEAVYAYLIEINAIMNR